MYHSLSTRRSAHLERTTLGTLSGPGALYGFRRLSCRRIWSLVILCVPQIGGGYSAISCVSIPVLGLLGKKTFANISPFSLFEVAIFSCPSTSILRFGVLVFLPSLAWAEMYLLAVQRSGLDAFSNQSRQ